MPDSSAMDEITFCEFSDSEDSSRRLTAIYNNAYTAEFPDADERESLDNMLRYLQLKSSGWYGKNDYHIVAAISGDKALGLAVADYLYEANCGVVEFLMTVSENRRSGVGAQLLSRVQGLLERDALRAGKDKLSYVLAEMNDPFAIDSLDDNLDPFIRARIWSGWGYKRLDFAYVQPALSIEQNPVENLILICKPVSVPTEGAMSRNTLLEALRGYMKWAMRIDDPGANAEYQAMAQDIGDAPTVRLASLGEYVGYDPHRELQIDEISERSDSKLDQALSVYTTSFPASSIDVSADEIDDFISQKHLIKGKYHFWALRLSQSTPVEGIASFFTLEHAGFAGYVAFIGKLRKAKRFPLLLARMEEAIRRDAPGVEGMYLECEPEKVGFFAQFDFRTVDFNYLQPPLISGTPYSVADAPKLKLMYRQLGGKPSPLSRDNLLQALREIFAAVYAVKDVDASPFFQAMRDQSKHWGQTSVPFADSP